MMQCYYLFTDTIYDEDEVLLALAEQVQVVDCISEKAAGSPNSRYNYLFKFKSQVWAACKYASYIVGFRLHLKGDKSIQNKGC